MSSASAINYIIHLYRSFSPINECYFIGGSPYPGIKPRQIAERLQKGYRMPKPKHVDDKLWVKAHFIVSYKNLAIKDFQFWLSPF